MRQPWAWAIIHGGKDVENRTRNVAGGYRGPVAIHAAGRYVDDVASAYVIFGTPSWVALLEWLEFHGIDPREVPAATRISRDACNRCIRYVRIVRDEHGNQLRDPHTHDWVRAAAIEQGEAPPLPYPAEVAELLRPVTVGG